ncbi:hypothetical protein J4226_06065 [Candidatus Pacearchaeota archaeon]|nr:hypothetical protein [Candidatus Pacearchaeota archaeon]
MEKQYNCEKCGGTGRIKEKNGMIHTCFHCLESGGFDQHDKKLKNAQDLGIKL